MTDTWRPGASRRQRRARAELYARLRAFFAGRGVLEVDLPLMASTFVSDPYIQPVVAQCQGRPHYLQSSPEYAMKRLLAADGEDIYSLGKVFRDGECGRRHNPEFTLLEWYRLGYDDRALMDEVAALVQSLIPGIAVQRLSYRQWFEHHLGVDPHRASVETLRAMGREHIEIDDSGLDADAWLDLLVTHVLEPALGTGLTLIYDYPASQAALARVLPDATGQPVARRFEAFLGRMELANGYWELTDASEQRRRFEQDQARRRRQGLPCFPLDEKLLAALAAGLPDCAGVALGVDRLLMQMTGATTIGEVLNFAFDRV